VIFVLLGAVNSSSTDEMVSPDGETKNENHTYSIQGKSLQAGNNKKYVRIVIYYACVACF